MTALEKLLLAIDTCVWRLEHDEIVPSAEMFALADEAQALGASLDLEGRVTLSARVARVSEVLARKCQAIETRVDALHVGRRAIRAYDDSTYGRANR